MEWLPLKVNYTALLDYKNATIVARLQLVRVDGRWLRFARPITNRLYPKTMRMEEDEENRFYINTLINILAAGHP